MAKINKIFMENVKGTTTTQELTGMDLFIGRNGVGKSTRLETVACTILGYIPGKGKKEINTLESASADAMTVGLELEGGFSALRTFAKKVTRHRNGTSDVKFTQDVNVAPLQGETTNTKKVARIEQELGKFPVMLDVAEFLQKNDTQKRDFFYSLLAGIPGSCIWTQEKVVAYLEKELLPNELKANDPDQHRIMSEILAKVSTDFPKGDIQEAIAKLFDDAKSKQSYWTEQRDNLNSTVQTLTDAKNKLGVTDRELTANKAKLVEIDKAIVESEKELATNVQKNNQIDEVQEALIFARKDFEDIKKDMPKEKASDLQKLITTEEAKLQVVDFVGEIDALNSNIKAHKEALTPAEKSLQDIVDEGTKLKTSMENLEVFIEKITKHTSKGKCGLDSKLPCNQDFSNFINETKAEIDGIKVQRKKLVAKYQAAELDVRKIKGAIEKKELLVAELIKKEREANNSNNAIQKSIRELTKRLQEVQSFDKVKDSRLKSKAAEIADLEKKPKQYFEVDELKIRIFELKGERDALNKTIEEQSKAKNTLTNLKNAQLEASKAEYHITCYKYLVETLGTKGLKGQIVKDMLEPIAKDVQTNLEAMGVTNQFYFDTRNEYGQEVFYFGWINGEGRKVKFDSLSTGQQMLLLTALMVTFIEASDPVVKILSLDNIENMDRENRKLVYAGLSKISHKLDNLILGAALDPEDIPVEAIDAGFKVWNLTKDATAQSVATA